jgi:hypothetical protein
MCRPEDYPPYEADVPDPVLVDGVPDMDATYGARARAHSWAAAMDPGAAVGELDYLTCDWCFTPMREDRVYVIPDELVVCRDCHDRDKAGTLGERKTPFAEIARAIGVRR